MYTVHERKLLLIGFVGQDTNSLNLLQQWLLLKGKHAAVATAPCFLIEVKNACMSLLIPVERDGIDLRDRG